MSDPTYTSSNTNQRSQEETSTNPKPRVPPREQPQSELQLAIVTSNDGPHRGTISPPNLTGIERMETWMSVDMTIVVDLSTWR